MASHHAIDLQEPGAVLEEPNRSAGSRLFRYGQHKRMPEK